MDALLVLAVYWLTSGDPAFDYMPKAECQAIATLTHNTGGVILELADGSHVAARKVACLEVCPDPVAWWENHKDDPA